MLFLATMLGCAKDGSSIYPDGTVLTLFVYRFIVFIFSKIFSLLKI